jgi:hypothetical protein
MSDAAYYQDPRVAHLVIVCFPQRPRADSDSSGALRNLGSRSQRSESCCRSGCRAVQQVEISEHGLTPRSRTNILDRQHGLSISRLLILRQLRCSCLASSAISRQNFQPCRTTAGLSVIAPAAPASHIFVITSVVITHPTQGEGMIALEESPRCRLESTVSLQPFPTRPQV